MLGKLGGAFAVALLIAAPAARASGPLSATVGDPGVATRDGTIRYVAVPAGRATAVEQIRTRGGHVVSWATVPGLWGTASVGNGTSTDGQGLSHDGRTLVLAHTGVPQGASTTFVVVDTRKMQVRDRIVLKGQFSFDALSPDASRMYVIQFAQDDQLHYVVRAYDMAAHRLVAGRIADKAQLGWVMQGVASSRVASPDGRWVYTLYSNPAGYGFVHALDTVQGVAHCVGIPVTDQAAVDVLRMTLHGSTLALGWHDGRVFRTIDTRTWRISRPVRATTAHGGGAARSSVAVVASGGALALLAVAGLVLLRRRRRASGQPRLA
jgi:MYXO-CTERM domain-containing protein